MANNLPQNNSMAGGVFIVIGLFIGIAAGIFMGQISLGLIIGFGVGVAAAIVTWLIDRNRHSGN